MNLYDTIFTPITGPEGVQQIVITGTYTPLSVLAVIPDEARGAWIAAASTESSFKFGFRMDGANGIANTDPHMIWLGRNALQLTNRKQLELLTLALEPLDSAILLVVQFFKGQIGTTR